MVYLVLADAAEAIQLLQGLLGIAFSIRASEVAEILHVDDLVSHVFSACELLVLLILGIFAGPSRQSV